MVYIFRNSIVLLEYDLMLVTSTILIARLLNKVIDIKNRADQTAWKHSLVCDLFLQTPKTGFLV